MMGFKTCAVCGTVLQTGETCNCQQPIGRAFHRDGLTATCPLFSHRSTYRGRYYINCVRPDGMRTRFVYRTNTERNNAYAAKCCHGGGHCRSAVEREEGK